jgi:hypothetical protein
METKVALAQCSVIQRPVKIGQSEFIKLFMSAQKKLTQASRLMRDVAKLQATDIGLVLSLQHVLTVGESANLGLSFNRACNKPSFTFYNSLYRFFSGGLVFNGASA